MQALFVHGMGRSPLSGWPILLRLNANGMKVSTFRYLATFQVFRPSARGSLRKFRNSPNKAIMCLSAIRWEAYC
ncbi:MAG: hypothetical protein LUQ57_01510 [Methylococcaceae bacterium]|nr:hypothetical protein [Methylococcaceae bacterium]